MNTDDIKRIEDLEYKYNEVSRVMAALDMVFDEYTNIKDWICELKDYLESGQWRKDFEADEKGELPKDLKRGILSEDGLFDLLADVKMLLERGKEICCGAKVDKLSYEMAPCQMSRQC
jgi:hypothetical protein